MNLVIFEVTYEVNKENGCFLAVGNCYEEAKKKFASKMQKLSLTANNIKSCSLTEP